MKSDKAQLQQDMNRASEAVETALQQARQAGASAAECALAQTQGINVQTRMGEVETVEFNQDGSLGITLYRGQRKGSASTSDLSPTAISAAVTKADAIARWTSEDPHAGLAPKELMAGDYADPQLFYPAELGPEYASEQALACERAALAQDDRIVNSDGAGYSSHCGFRVYGNSHGFLGSYMSSRQSLSCVLIGQHGDAMERDYAYTLARNPADLTAPEQVAREAVENTLSRLGARSVPTTRVPVIFHHSIAHGLFGHLVGAISGGNLYRKASFLLDHLGEQVLPEWLTIEERPLIPGGLASSPFDHEGVATRDRTIVRDGVLQSYLLTSYAARKLAMQPTGHAGGIHNWRLNTGQQSLTDLCQQMGTGLLVTELMGQGVNMVTGDYSRGAAGFWVEQGEIQYPVSEVTIAGNLKDMLRNIVAIGQDVDERHGIHCGSVLLDELKVAGS